MPDTRTTGLTAGALTAADLVMVVDVEDTSMAATGTNKKRAAGDFAADMDLLSPGMAAVTSLAGWNAAKILNLARVAAGYHPVDGCALSPSATTGKLDMALGHFYIKPADVNAGAETAFGNTVATILTNAGSTTGQSMWVVIEGDSAGDPQQNPGTPSSLAPQIPDPTAGRCVLGYLWIPHGATEIDTVLGSLNGKAKLYDGRLFRPSPVRSLITDVTMTRYTAGTATNWLTNGTTLTQIGPTAPQPANSVRAGDSWQVAVGLLLINNATATTLRLQLSMGGTTIIDLTNATNLATSANPRSIRFNAEITCTGVFLKTIGSHANYALHAPVTKGSPAGHTENLGVVDDTSVALAGANDIILKAALGAASAGATLDVESFKVTKVPLAP